MKYNWYRILTSFIIVVTFFTIAIFSIGVDQAQAQDANVECRVGFPEVVSLDPNSTESGTIEISRDIVTNSILMAKLRGGTLAGFSIMNNSGEVFDLTPTQDLTFENFANAGGCLPPLCLVSQPPRCYSTPWGGCICSCGPFIAAPSLPN